VTPELQAKLEASASELIDFIKAGGATTIDFAKEQVPLVVEEMIRWGWWGAMLGIAFGIVTFGLCAACVGYIRVSLRKGDEPFFSVVIAALSFVIGAAALTTNTATAIKITVAPRLYLIDQLKEIAK
jgi:hypothetical protein